LIFALTFHEFSHAYVAHLCGDDTAKFSGRMSINPFTHLDLLGSIMVLIAGFGYARPVPVNPANYKIRNAEFYIASAGPLMNFFLGLSGTLILIFSNKYNIYNLGGIPILEFLYLFILINFNLCFFNLIPIGPLDGSSVFPHFLPYKLRIRFQDWNYHHGTQALMILVILSIILPNFSAFSWISYISKSLIIKLT